MKSKKLLLIPIVIIVVAGLIVLWYLLSRPGRDARALRVSGNIEVTDAEVSFKIPGLVKERPVDEGQRVEAGQVIARLETADLEADLAVRRAEVQAVEAALAELLAGSRPEEIAQAEAAMGGAQAKLDELLAGSRPEEIAAAEAVAQSAKAETDRLRVEYDRADALFKASAMAQTDYDRASMQYSVATARLAETEARLKLAKEGPRKEDIAQGRAALAEATQRYDLVRKGPRQETIDQARGRLAQAKAAQVLSETRLSYATLRSPLTGVALSKNVEVGEYVAPGTPVITVGDLVNVWLRAYINETDLGRVKLGQPVRVTADTWPGKTYEGRVSFISSEAEFTPKQVQTRQERVKLVYRIKIDIANPQMELKPGMPADAEIRTDEVAK